jgi:hypothetical protein
MVSRPDPDRARDQVPSREWSNSLLPLLTPEWLVGWCLATWASAMLTQSPSRIGRAGWSLLLTLDSAASGAVVITGFFVFCRLVYYRVAVTTAPGAWLLLIATLRMLLLVIPRAGQDVGLPIPMFVWYGVISSLLFLAPFYFGHVTANWYPRWVSAVVLQSVPLLVRLLLALTNANSASLSGDTLLARCMYVPDLVVAVLFATGSHRWCESRDPWHRPGIILFSIQVVIAAIATFLLP